METGAFSACKLCKAGRSSRTTQAQLMILLDNVSKPAQVMHRKQDSPNLPIHAEGVAVPMISQTLMRCSRSQFSSVEWEEAAACSFRASAIRLSSSHHPVRYTSKAEPGNRPWQKELLLDKRMRPNIQACGVDQSSSSALDASWWTGGPCESSAALLRN